MHKFDLGCVTTNTAKFIGTDRIFWVAMSSASPVVLSPDKRKYPTHHSTSSNTFQTFSSVCWWRFWPCFLRFVIRKLGIVIPVVVLSFSRPLVTFSLVLAVLVWRCRDSMKELPGEWRKFMVPVKLSSGKWLWWQITYVALLALTREK